MAHATRRPVRFRASSLGVTCAVLLGVSSASALAPTVLTIAGGHGGEKAKNGGAGNEQPTVVAVTNESGERYVVVIYMSSDVDAGQGLDPWQCKCSSIHLSKTAPPEIVADQVYLTHNTNTNRPCNHPFAATDGKRIVWAHGHNENNGNTQTYVQAIDEMCRPLGSTFMISDAGSNAQQGAPEIRFLSGEAFVAGYYHDGNDDDHTYVRGLTLAPDNSIEASYRVAAVDDNSIGRPAIATSGDKALICASRGDNRPPEDGVACAWINARSGVVYWRDKVVVASDPGNKVYMNQPSLASLGNGRFVLQVIESTGQGKNTDIKGVSRTHLYVLEPRDSDGPGAEGMMAAISDVGVYQTHTAVISGKYADKGETFVGLFEAPITGSSLPVISFFSYDVNGQKWNPFDETHDQWIVGANDADSGKLANLYGANPGKQGRDFMRGIGDVQNPGAGVDGGWMSVVKSFFVLPYAGMRAGEDKNALFLSFLPGETSVPPSPPELPDPPGDAGTVSTGAGTAHNHGRPSLDDTAGCACGVAGTSGGPGGLALVGAALLALARCRRNARGSRH
jgi:MYXO-CTERM domain-containing protein